MAIEPKLFNDVKKQLHNYENKISNFVTTIDKYKLNEIHMTQELIELKATLKSSEATNLELKRIIEKKKVEHANDNDRFMNIIENCKSEINAEKTKVAELKTQVGNIIKSDINHAKEITNKDRTIALLKMENKIKVNRIEDMTVSLNKEKTERKLIENLLEDIRQECAKSINKFKTVQNENVVLKSRITGIDYLKDKIVTQERNAISLKNKLKNSVLELNQLKTEMIPLLDRIKQLEDLKTKHIYVGKNIGDVIQDLKKCNIENQRIMDKFNSNDQIVLLGDQVRKIGDDSDEYDCIVLKQKQYQNKIYKLEKENAKLTNKLERQNEIISKYKITLTHSRHAEDKCVTELTGCKENEMRKYHELIFCESDKLDKDRKNSKLEIINFNKSEQIRLLQAQDKNLRLTIKKLYDELHFKRKEYLNSQQTEFKLIRENEQLRKQINNYQISLNTYKKLVNSNKNHESSQKLRNINEKQIAEQLQNKIHILQGSLNEEKHKNKNLLEELKTQKEQFEINKKINLGELSDLSLQNKKFSRQNANLKFKNNAFAKFKNINESMKMELNEMQRNYTNARKLINTMKTENKIQLHSVTIPEMIWPNLKKERLLKRKLILQNVTCRAKLKKLENEKIQHVDITPDIRSSLK